MICPTCKIDQELNEDNFIKSNRYDFYYSECRVCASIRAKFSSIKRKYGITRAAYEHLLIEQNDNCAICLDPLGMDINVEHSHETNKIRGLVHRKCNSIISWCDERTDVLKNMINYLDTHNNKKGK